MNRHALQNAGFICATFSVLSGAFVQQARAQNANPIQIEHLSYHPATHGPYEEKWQEDFGGVITFFVRNRGDVEQKITGIEINGSDLGTLQANGQVVWSRIWPPTLAPGTTSVVTVKTNQAPLIEGGPIVAVVRTESGWVHHLESHLRASPLRIGSVVPSDDLRALVVSVRNVSSASQTLDEIWLHQNVTNQSIFLGGRTLEPQSVALVKIPFSQGVSIGSQTPIQVLSHPVSSSLIDNAGVWVGSQVRILEPEFALGTWNSQLPSSEEGMISLRKLHINRSVSQGSWEKLPSMSSRYFIKGLDFATEGEGANVELVASQAQNQHLSTWYLRDEPDHSTKSPSAIAAQNLQFWENDSSHPTFLNMNTTRAFSTYGHIADIAGVDHYVMYAPNNIPNSGITRIPRLEEAFDFAEVLKQNVEPRPVWNWSQLASSGWPRQAYAFGVSSQFWANVMAGAKGNFFFVAQPDTQEKFPEQYAEALLATNQLNAIRNLCLHGETVANINSSNSKIRARSLISEHALVVVAANFDYDTSGWIWQPDYQMNSAQTTLSIPLPSWISADEVWEITPEGKKSVSHTRNGNNIILQVSLQSSTGVFVIGAADITPPNPPDHLNKSLERPDGTLVLSWNEPKDDVGIFQYLIFANDVQIGAVRSPVFETKVRGNFSIVAQDASGNKSVLSPALTVP